MATYDLDLNSIMRQARQKKAAGMFLPPGYLQDLMEASIQSAASRAASERSLNLSEAGQTTQKEQFAAGQALSRESLGRSEAEAEKNRLLSISESEKNRILSTSEAEKNRAQSASQFALNKEEQEKARQAASTSNIASLAVQAPLSYMAYEKFYDKLFPKTPTLTTTTTAPSVATGPTTLPTEPMTSMPEWLQSKDTFTAKPGLEAFTPEMYRSGTPETAGQMTTAAPAATTPATTGATATMSEAAVAEAADWGTQAATTAPSTFAAPAAAPAAATAAPSFLSQLSQSGAGTGMTIMALARIIPQLLASTGKDVQAQPIDIERFQKGYETLAARFKADGRRVPTPEEYVAVLGRPEVGTAGLDLDPITGTNMPKPWNDQHYADLFEKTVYDSGWEKDAKGERYFGGMSLAEGGPGGYMFDPATRSRFIPQSNEELNIPSKYYGAQPTKPTTLAANTDPTKKDGCIIITACTDRYSPEVEIARTFRDKFLDQDQLRGYYFIAEKIVPFIESNKTVKRMVKKWLVDRLIDYGAVQLGIRPTMALRSSWIVSWAFLTLIRMSGKMKKQFVRINGEVF